LKEAIGEDSATNLSSSRSFSAKPSQYNSFPSKLQVLRSFFQHLLPPSHDLEIDAILERLTVTMMVV
jgi:hypothetical protein